MFLKCFNNADACEFSDMSPLPDALVSLASTLQDDTDYYRLEVMVVQDHESIYTSIRHRSAKQRTVKGP